MKRTILSLIFLAILIAGHGSEWIPVTSQRPVDAKVQVIRPDISNPVLKFTLGGFNLNPVTTPLGSAYTVSAGETTPILDAGAPDLPKMNAALVIPDMAGMEVRVVSSSYQDFPNLDIAPSKGVIIRDTDPATVPYQYGQVYNENKFYPANIAGLRDPFIARDLRGQTVLVYPFSYNPVARTLRVFYEVTVELVKVTEVGLNTLSRAGTEIRISPEWAAIYGSEFFNFDAVTYTPLEDYGKMLVLANNAFMTDMQPFVDWKNSIGIPTEMVDVATAGSTAAAIKTYITDYYNTNGLTFVLLVGDNAQIPTNQGGGLGGPSDNAYGYIVGNDHFSDLFVGRFSAENVAHVQTQVQRTLNYEKDPQLITDDWYTTVIGIASSQGPGDDGEFDYQHIRNLQTECLAYNYTWNPELFDGSQGGNDAAGNPTPAQVATEVNNGSGLILYTGHGSETSWGTSGFSNSNVNQLTNQDKLPFIWSVACVNGNFLNTTCFAEAWLRASQGGQPTGAVAFLGATINQSWNSPMEGEDEMVKILTEQYSSNIKHTFAGISINGCMKMIDAYGTDGSNMADTWTVFGDPSLLVRTDNPQTLIVSHDPTLFVGATQLTVNCNVEGARATATLDGVILATGLISGGSAVLTFTALQNPQDSVHLVVTAYNYIPDISDIPVITPTGPYIVYVGNTVNDAAGNNNQLVDYSENIYLAVEVKNLGVAPTTSLEVKVRTMDPYIQQTDSTEAYGVIDPNQTKSVPDGYYFEVSGNIPDGHVIPFTMTAVDDTLTWITPFSITAHAPNMGILSTTVLDPGGNNNGRLDPGETASIEIYIQNSGSSQADNVMANLVAISPYVTVTNGPLSYGDLGTGQNNFNTFSVTVDPSAPEGQTAPFLLEISADRGVATVGTFSLIIGRMPMVVVDYDGNTSSGPALETAALNLGLLVDYKVTMPQDLDNYKSMFVCLGVYADNTVLPDADALQMKDYLDAGGRAYMEGGDTWFYDPQTVVHPMFHITGTGDGNGDLAVIIGQAGTFTEGMEYSYAGDNQYIDHLDISGGSFTIFKNSNPAYPNAVAYDGGIYRTIGSSFEFGGLQDAVYPSTKNHLLEKYLEFFGIDIPALTANFAGYPTSIYPGGLVSFYDFSAGGVTSWNWSFPGGTPETSTEKNPVVFYNTPGTYDVQLIVSNGIMPDTLVKAGYIDVNFPVGTGEKSAELKAAVIPNPSTGSFILDLAAPGTEKVTARIFNLLGTVVFEKDLVVDSKLSQRVSLNVPDGIYILSLRGQSSTIAKRILIRK
jgi:PKD repeat protein